MKKVYSNIIFLLTRKEKQRFYALMLLNLLSSLADIASIAFLFLVINFYSPELISSNTYFQPGRFFQQHSMIPALLLIVVFIVKSFFGYSVSKMHFRFVNNVASRISAEKMLQYLEGNFADYINIDSAAFIRRICFLPVEFAQFVLSGFLQMTTEIVLIILTITALLFYDAKLLMIVSAVLLPAVVFLSYVTKKRLGGIRKDLSSANEKNLQFLNEALTGYVESNIYNKNVAFTERYSSMQQVVNNYVANLQITQGMPSRFFEAFAILGLFLLIAAGLYNAAENATGIFTLGAYMAAAYKIIPGISKIINSNSSAKTYHYAMNELVNSKASFEKEKDEVNKEKLSSIVVRDISFSYNNNLVLNNFNCKFDKSSFTAITGSSGKGKTTLMNILLGFLCPASGVVLFNERTVNEAIRRNFWNRIAYVKQEAFMLHDSILRNIILIDESYDAVRLQEVIKNSCVAAFIESFPEGINKIITENGKNISGGQRQRIAIARALYKDADVIILDEPFNELDEVTELKMMQYFQWLAAKGKIVILITHNSSNLHFCTNIISLDEH